MQYNNFPLEDARRLVVGEQRTAVGQYWRPLPEFQMDVWTDPFPEAPTQETPEPIETNSAGWTGTHTEAAIPDPNSARARARDLLDRLRGNNS